MQRLRVAAIDFLNPAPLMWDFEHAPRAAELAERYALEYMLPSECAAALLAGRADLGLIPVAALTAELAVVPGCTIASLGRVRSIQLIVKADRPLERVRTVAADRASRSSLGYAQVLFRRFVGTAPEFVQAPADAVAMLRGADAALLIGDPALLALEARAETEAAVGPCVWLDLAEEWVRRTGLPWVAAVWAVRTEALDTVAEGRLVEDLQGSRDRGLEQVEALVEEWVPRIALDVGTIREYLTKNIHYVLTEECVAGMELFRRYAAELGVLPELGAVRFL